MQHSITYSIRKAIESYVPEVFKVVVFHDGMKLEDLEKPYVLVQYVQTSSRDLSAGRESYQNDLMYALDIQARDINELNKIESRIRDTVLRRKNGIPFYLYNEDTGKFELTDLTLELDEVNFTPLYAEDITKESEYHKGTFVIMAGILRTIGENTFTQ